MSELTQMSGSAQAALLLMALGEQEAAKVLTHMDPKEVQALGMAMADLGNVTQDQIGHVLQGFVGDVRNQSSLGLGSNDYFKNVLQQAFGKEKASSVLPGTRESIGSKGLETLKWMSSQSIAEMIGKEHPQIITIVLAFLDSQVAGEVLGMLPESLRSDLLLRIATLDQVSPSALREVDELVARQFAGGSDPMVSGIGGTKMAADMLNVVSSDIETAILEKINEKNPELSGKIQDLMMTFDTVNDIDDRGIQTLLREVASDTLVIALKGADPETREKIFKNMSSRASELMREDLEAKGPVRLSEVEQAQKEVMEIVRRMAEEGQIMLGGKGEDFV